MKKEKKDYYIQERGNLWSIPRGELSEALEVGYHEKAQTRKTSCESVLTIQDAKAAGCKCWLENRLDVFKRWVCAKINRSCDEVAFAKEEKELNKRKKEIQEKN